MDWGQLPNPVMTTAITLGHYNGEKGSGWTSAIMLTWLILIRLGDGEEEREGKGQHNLCRLVINFNKNFKST